MSKALKPPKGAAAAVTLVAVEPILSGGVRYEPGKLLTVDEAAAAQLLGMGAAKSAQAKAPRAESAE